MAITTLNASDSGSTSRTVINDNFTDVTSSLALKANLASPTFTGTPSLPTGTTAVTQSPGDNSTKLATTAYVDASATSKAKLRVAKSGTQAVAATTAQVTFDTEDLDIGSNFASNQFTAPRTGYYLVNFMTSYASNSASTEETNIEIRVNGTAVLKSTQTSASSDLNEYYNISVVGLLSLTASDLVTVYCITDSHTATLQASTFTKLSILET